MYFIGSNSNFGLIQNLLTEEKLAEDKKKKHQ